MDTIAVDRAAAQRTSRYEGTEAARLVGLISPVSIGSGIIRTVSAEEGKYIATIRKNFNPELELIPAEEQFRRVLAEFGGREIVFMIANGVADEAEVQIFVTGAGICKDRFKEGTISAASIDITSIMPQEIKEYFSWVRVALGYVSTEKFLEKAQNIADSMNRPIKVIARNETHSFTPNAQ